MKRNAFALFLSNVALVAQTAVGDLDISGRTVNLEKAKEILGDLNKRGSAPNTSKAFQKIVADFESHLREESSSLQRMEQLSRLKTPPDNIQGLVPEGTTTVFFLSGRDAALEKPLSYRIGPFPLPNIGAVAMPTITVPTGFVTDFASIPQLFQSIIPKLDRYNSAAVVHDFLYWVQATTRKQADDILFAAMKESGVSHAKAATIYAAVRLRGGSSWTENSQAKKSGFIRIVPPEYFNLVKNASCWASLREDLRKKGVTEPDQSEAIKQQLPKILEAIKHVEPPAEPEACGNQ